MMVGLDGWSQWAEQILDALGRASIQGAIAIAGVALLCRLVPRLPASLRCSLWWLACLGLLVGLAWSAPVALPVLPAVEPAVETVSPPSPSAWPVEAATPSTGQGPGVSYVPASSGWRSRPISAGHPSPGGPGGRTGEGPGVRSLLLGAWLSGILLQTAWMVRQHRRTRRLLRRSAPASATRVGAITAGLQRALGLRGDVEVLRSAEVATPQATGLFRPRVLLPDGELERLSDDELAMTLCHELLHVRRGDLWLGWVPALAERLFFFHPLAALAGREYALAREAACDAEVLRVLGAAPQAYGRLLVRLGVTPPAAAWAAAGAAPSIQTLKRRLEMLQQIPKSSRVHVGWWLLAGLVALAAVVPFRLVAQQAEGEEPAAPTAPVAATAPVAPVAAVAPTPAAVAATATAPVAVVATAAGGSVEAVTAIAPMAPIAVATTPVAVSAVPVTATAIAPLAPTAVAVSTPSVAPVAAVPVVAVAAAPQAPGQRSGYSYRTGDDGDSYVFLYGDSSTMVNGSSSDIRRAKELRGDGKGDLLWFRRGGKAYVVRDAVTLAAARKLFEPQAELGAEQAELGSKQAELGSRQAELGAQQAELGRRQAELAAQQAKLAAEVARRNVDGRSTDDLESQMDELGEQMGELGAQQGELGRKQGELGHQQGRLGAQQGELGARQGKLAQEAEQKLRALMDQAVRDGRAQEVER